MTDKKRKRTPLPFFCAFFQIAFTKFSHQGKVSKSLYKTKNVARRPQNFELQRVVSNENHANDGKIRLLCQT